MEDIQRVEESYDLVNELEMDKVMQSRIELCPSSVERQCLNTEAGHTGMKTCGH